MIFSEAAFIHVALVPPSNLLINNLGVLYRNKQFGARKAFAIDIAKIYLLFAAKKEGYLRYCLLREFQTTKLGHSQYSTAGVYVNPLILGYQ